MGERKLMEEEEIVEVEGLMEVLTKVELDLAYSSEKLVNLNGLLMQLSAQENEHEAAAAAAAGGSAHGGEASPEFIEKALVFSLLSGVLESEVRELDSFMVSLEAGILDAHRNISSCRHLPEPYAVLRAKLLDSDESLKQTRHQISELDIQSAKLQRTAQALAHGKCGAEEDALESNGEVSLRMAGQRHILHMLEKSLARELELEKKLSESRRREEETRVKLRYAEQAAIRAEEDAQASWGRFLEADCSSAVLEGITRDLFSGLRAAARRESALRSELDGGSSRIRVTELESLVESLRESVEIADTRAESAELKVAELIGTNAELTEELGFLKESAGAAEKKVGALEKQVREAGVQLQNARASSEAGQEQQNMLYSAIWDMETLIEDLKSKVAKAEAKNESTEENCIALSETNAELTKEMSDLRDQMDDLGARLEEAKSAKNESADEVDAMAKLIMDLVAQLATERERIQKQLNTLSIENEKFAKKVGFKAQNGSVGHENGEKDDGKELRSSSCAQSSLDTTKDSAGKSCQSNEPLEEAPPSDDCDRDPTSVNTGNGSVSKPEEDSQLVSPRRGNLKYVCVAIFVSLLSVLVMYFINHKLYIFQ